MLINIEYIEMFYAFTEFTSLLEILKSYENEVKQV